MRSFMKTHLRNSPIFDRQKSSTKNSKADDTEPISPLRLKPKSHHHRKKSKNNRKSLTESHHKSHSSISSIDTEVSRSDSAHFSTESPSRRQQRLSHKHHSSDGSKILRVFDDIKEDISNPFLTSSTPTKRKLSVKFSELPSSSSSSLPSMKSDSNKSGTLHSNHSVDNILRGQSFKVCPYTTFPPLPDRSTTIYGTKTHNWGVVDTKKAELKKRPLPLPESRVPIAPPLPKSTVRFDAINNFKVSPPVSIPHPRPNINASSNANSVDNGVVDGSKSPLSLARKSTSLTDIDMSDDECFPKYNPEALFESHLKRKDGKQDNQDNQDDPEVSDSDSSKFSFQLTGRNASIKYYKTKEQVKVEQEVKSQKKNVDKFVQFINSSEPLEQLDDDLNYIDVNAKDETDDLFNRDLFSDDEDDGIEDEYTSITELQPNVPVVDRLEKDSNQEISDNSVSEATKACEIKKIQKETPAVSPEAEVNLLLEQLRSTKIDPGSAGIIIPKSSDVSEDLIESDNSTEGDIFADYKDLSDDENDQSPLEITTVQDGKNLNPKSSSTPENKYTNSDHSGSLGLKARRSKLKYHQINSKIQEDNMDFIKNRYSWLGGEGEPKIDDFQRVSMASSPSVDNSLLDEVNQVSSDYESDVNLRYGIPDDEIEQVNAPVLVDQVQQLDNSIINLSKKTITLFNGLSSENGTPNSTNSLKHDQTVGKHLSQTRPSYVDILEDGGNSIEASADTGDTSYNPDFYDQYTESAEEGDGSEDLSFVPDGLAPNRYRECSFLTTISEASFESSRSVHSDH